MFLEKLEGLFDFSNILYGMIFNFGILKSLGMVLGICGILIDFSC